MRNLPEHLLIRLQKAVHYRQCATILKEMSQTAPSALVAKQLGELAAQYERLADRFDGLSADK
jgi:hypothetical protein